MNGISEGFSDLLTMSKLLLDERCSRAVRYPSPKLEVLLCLWSDCIEI